VTEATLPNTGPQPRPADATRALLEATLKRARWTIFWERLWPALTSLATAIGLFLALSWLGLWLWLPPLGRAVVVIGFALLTLGALVPLGFMLWQSALSPETAASAARFTLDNYRTAYASADTARLLANSLQFACGSAVLAFSFGAVLAWINERTDTPFKALFFALTLVPLIIPGILFTVSWIFLGSPKIGIVNLVLQRIFDTDAVFINIYSIPGMIWVDGLHYSPMAFLLMTAAFRAMDPALEESAMMSGATLPRILWRVTIRLASPATAAALLILFVRALESFEVPALLGLPAGIEVYTSAIYDAIHAYPSEIGLASAYGVALLVITSLCVLLNLRIVDARKALAHQPALRELPQLVSIGPVPLALRVMPLVLKAHSDAIPDECPHFLDKPVVHLFGPLAREESNDFVSSVNKL